MDQIKSTQKYTKICKYYQNQTRVIDIQTNKLPFMLSLYVFRKIAWFYRAYSAVMYFGSLTDRVNLIRCYDALQFVMRTCTVHYWLCDLHHLHAYTGPSVTHGEVSLFDHSESFLFSELLACKSVRQLDDNRRKLDFSKQSAKEIRPQQQFAGIIRYINCNTVNPSVFTRIPVLCLNVAEFKNVFYNVDEPVTFRQVQDKTLWVDRPHYAPRDSTREMRKWTYCGMPTPLVRLATRISSQCKPIDHATCNVFSCISILHCDTVKPVSSAFRQQLCQMLSKLDNISSQKNLA